MLLLEVIGVNKKYGKIKAVEELSFSLEKGEILGLLGPNGAGKSTTISMISSLLKPDSGHILYKGNSIIKNPGDLQKDLGYVPQEVALYQHLTGYENLKFWGKVLGINKKELKERIMEISQLIGMESRIYDLVDSYSGGMKRRLNLGVALLNKPKIMILDEPTVGIDPQSRNHIMETILKLKQEENMSVIFTSHYIDEIEGLCDRICIIDHGRIIASGTKDELVRGCNLNTKIIIEIDQKDQHDQSGQKDQKNQQDQKNQSGQCDEVLETFMSSQKMIHADVKIEVYDLKEQKISISFDESKMTFKELIDELNQINAKILTIEMKRPNLESVFFELTSRELRD